MPALTKQERDNIIESRIGELAAALNLGEPMTKDFLRHVIQMAVLFDAKQHDYGSGNIGAFGTLGIMVRINDKVERLKNVLSKKRGKTKNETIMDSLVDIANYAIIGQMVEKGEWR